MHEKSIGRFIEFVVVAVVVFCFFPSSLVISCILLRVIGNGREVYT